MSDGIEILPSLRMAESMLRFVEMFFEEEGCPLSDEQSAALRGARQATHQQAASVGGAA